MTAIIPSFQNLPPAGHEKILAYRPACSQLESQRLGEKVQWFIPLATGENHVLGTRSPMPLDRAHSSLDSAGLCKVGGENVPIVSPSEAIASTRPSVELVPVTQSSQWHQQGLIAVAVAIVVGGIAYSQWQTKREREAFFNG